MRARRRSAAGGRFGRFGRWSQPLVHAAVLVLPAILAGGVVAIIAVDAYREAAETRLLSSAQAIAAAVDNEFAVHEVALRTLAALGDLDDAASKAALARHAERLARDVGGWFVVTESLEAPRPAGQGNVVVDRQIINTRADDPLVDREHAVDAEAAAMLREAYDAAGDDRAFKVLDLFTGPVAGTFVAVAMLPLDSDRSGNDTDPEYFLFYVWRAATFDAILRKSATSATGFTAISDGRFRIVAHSEPSVPTGVPVPDWVPSVVEGLDKGVTTGPGFGNVPNVYAFARPERAPGWTVVAAKPRASLYSRALAFAWAIPAGLFLIAAGGLVVFNRQRAANAQEASALQQGREEIERFHESIPAIIMLLVVSPDGSREMIYHQGDFALVTDGTFDGPVPPELWDARCHEERMPRRDLYRRMVEHGEASDEYRFRRRDGAWIWLRYEVFRFGRIPDGRTEVIGYITNVTERREADANALAASRLASIGEMAAGIAHELKQPLATLSVAGQTGLMAVRRGELLRARQRIGSIETQVRRAADLVGYLRRFGSVEIDNANRPITDLGKVVSGALALVSGALNEAGIEVHVDVPDTAPVVRGEEMALVQVLITLLSNARDAIEAQPPHWPRRIDLIVEDDSDFATLTVRDTGGGIAPEVEPRLFEPFVTTKGPDKGLGLALSMAHGILVAIGAYIVARNLHDGAEFRVTLRTAAGEEKVE